MSTRIKGEGEVYGNEEEGFLGILLAIVLAVGLLSGLTATAYADKSIPVTCATSNGDYVHWEDYCGEDSGYWIIKASNDQYSVTLSNNESAHAAGTYAWSDLDPSYCYVAVSSQKINFTDCPDGCTVSVNGDVVNVSGVFKGEDEKYYAIDITYGETTDPKLNPIPYIDWNGTELVEKTGDDACTSYFLVNSENYQALDVSGVCIGSGAYAPGETEPSGVFTWIVIDGTVSFNNSISVVGTANVILCDRCTFNASNINISNGGSLTVYAGSTSDSIKGDGALTINNANGNAVSAMGGAMCVNGGVLNLTSKYKAFNDGGTITFNGGNFTAYATDDSVFDANLATVSVANGLNVVAGNSETTAAPVTDLSTWKHSEKWVHIETATHNHDFTYSASGATITVKCANTDGNCDLPPSTEGGTDHVATLTIVKPTMTVAGQTGEGISASATLEGLDEFNAATGLNVAATDIKYVGRGDTTYAESATAPTDGGEYTAKLTLSGVKTSAGEGQSVTASVDYGIEAQYPVWVGGTQVTGKNASDVFGDGKVSYTPATTEGETTTPATLTLNGYTYTGEGYAEDEYGTLYGAAIYAKEDLTISVTGDNSVTHQPAANTNSYGVYSTKNLTITGSGTLTATAGDVTGRNISSNGISANRFTGYLTIDKGGKVKANAGNCDMTNDYPGDSSGVCVGANITTINGALEAKGAKGHDSYGVKVYPKCTIVVGSNGSVNATAGEASGGKSAGINNADFTVNGTMNAAGGKSTTSSYGMMVYAKLEVGGTLEASGGEKGQGDERFSAGVWIEDYSSEKLNIGGAMTAKGNDSALVTYGNSTGSWATTPIEYTVPADMKVMESANYDGSGATVVAVDSTTAATSKYVYISPMPPHTHAFTYSASEANITATCSNADGNCMLDDGTEQHNHAVNLTIVAPTLTAYGQTGEGISASATLTGLDAFNAATGKSIAATDIKYYKATKSGTTYIKGDALSAAPTGAGDYMAEIALTNVKTGEGDGKSIAASIGYTIAKAEPTANAPTGLKATYGQKLSDVALANPSGNTPGTWAWADSSASVGNAGENAFKASFTPTDAANYNPRSDVDVTVTVDKAASPATVEKTATVVKGGNTIDLKDNVKLNGATGAVSYAIAGEASSCTLNGSVLTSGDKEGNVTVNVTVAADDNHNALATTPITVTISAKSAQTITAADVAATYGDTGKKIEASTTGDGGLGYAVKSGDAVTVDKDTGELAIKGAGSAVVTVTAAETDKYLQATKDVNVTIAKASIEKAEVTLTPSTFTYDGKAKEPQVTVKLGKTTLEGDADFTVKYADNVEPGTATVTVTGKGNYAGEAKAEFTIAYANETVYRLYHPVTGEHHYTKDAHERDVCVNDWGWNDEGVAWITPVKSSTPVYRVYDTWTGEHHYTSDAHEQEVLVGSGRWNDEGIAWYSDDAETVPVYRLERHDRGPLQHHHYTLDVKERNVCLNEWGWNDEGIGWYASAAPAKEKEQDKGGDLVPASL